MSDFISTWFGSKGRAADSGSKSDRLSGQLFDTYKSFLYPGLIIEHNPNDYVPYIYRWLDRAEEHLNKLNFHLNVVRTESITETVNYVLRRVRDIDDGWRPCAVKHTMARDHSVSDITNVCSVLNIGISEEKGRLLTERYGSLSNFITEVRSNPDGLEEVVGIGKKLRKRIIEKFGE